MIRTTKQGRKGKTGTHMSQSNAVSIGGIEYDSHTGLPLTTHKEAQLHHELRRVQSVQAQGVHKTQQRSAALNRQFVKKIAAAQQKPKSAVVHIDIKRPITRSPHISKFARDPQMKVVKRTASADIAPVHHPIVAKAHAVAAAAHTAKVAPVSQPTSQELKHAALGQALANASSTSKPVKQPRRRALNVAAASLGLLLITGYFTYVNMPNLSVRVAAAQAGIDASYPEYRPVGYRLDGPIAYQNGEVSMKFASNSAPLAFSLNQSKSSWDSSALLEKYVNPRSEGKYATYSDAGLTIYTYGTDAAWVNGGILYTVEGSALLSNEQIRRIATSM
jgi:hypothetical protein